jgi:Fe-S cluster assembly scaffold protein SufB
MEKTNVKNFINNGTLTIGDKDEKSFNVYINTSDIIDVSRIIIKEGTKVVLLVVDDVYVNLKVIQEKNSFLELKVFNKTQIYNSIVNIDIYENSIINFVFADFSIGNGTEEITVNLLGENAKCTWHLASISGESSTKEFKVFVNHIAPHTEALVSSYGVVKDTSKLVFSGTSHIKKGAIKSTTRQTSNIMVFSPSAIGNARPILRIDENDVIASHGAALGKINEEHLFYLKSRGIKEEIAKTLIIMGYITPIVKRFYDKDTKEEVEKLILKRLQYV